jgi:hypothetical protein
MTYYTGLVYCTVKALAIYVGDRLRSGAVGRVHVGSRASHAHYSVDDDLQGRSYGRGESGVLTGSG